MNFDFAAFINALTNAFIIDGVILTLWLSVASMAFGLVIGTILAIMRTYGSRPLVQLAKFYIWIFRGTPVLIQLVIIYTGLPQLGIRFSPIEAALIGFALNEAAYLAENLRAGIEAVPPGQVEAARALGIRPGRVLRRVVMPQAIRIAIPPIGNSFILLLKGTSIASVISVAELMRQTSIVANQNFRVLEMFLAAAVYYLILTSAWGIVQKRLELRFGRAALGPRIQKRNVVPVPATMDGPG